MSALRIFWATLREIFDEAAYERYLRCHGLTTSAQAYEQFQQDRRATQERKPRCC
jgi:hypothetical protein